MSVTKEPFVFFYSCSSEYIVSSKLWRQPFILIYLLFASYMGIKFSNTLSIASYLKFLQLLFILANIAK